MDELFGESDAEREADLIWTPAEAGSPEAPDVFGDTESADGVSAHDNLWWYADGTVWDLGPADIDADGDGVPESLTSGLRGVPAIVSDADGDGRVDRVTSVDGPDGVTERSLDGTVGEWSPTTLGRID
ncbi:hypothetical protein [Gordonia shandongensis]|uniref:hypothetical protein n=1 Tax=Gordonia shandongensis TaxID=376351 RepID=UPI0003F91AAB|nr:hypothetical protein [Gordonia shandongensis]